MGKMMFSFYWMDGKTITINKFLVAIVFFFSAMKNKTFSIAVEKKIIGFKNEFDDSTRKRTTINDTKRFESVCVQEWACSMSNYLVKRRVQHDNNWYDKYGILNLIWAYE